MAGVFPFREVERGAKIVLYGAGALGREFYIQLNDTNWCEILAWVDKSFKGYELSYPFDYVENIGKYKDADYIVIALADYDQGMKIEKWLIESGISDSKIINHPGEYFKDYRLFPTNRQLFLSRVDDYMDLMHKYLDSESIYAGKRWGFFYESFTGIGIEGVRSCQDRIEKYCLRNILKKNQRVLDIGCNSGFLATQIAPLVKEVIGIEIDINQVEVGKKAAEIAGINNVFFVATDFNEYNDDSKYDIIMSLAVHEYIVEKKEYIQNYVDKINNMLNTGGYFVFESQIRIDDMFYDICEILEHVFELQKKGSYFETFHMSEREYRIYKKN